MAELRAASIANESFFSLCQPTVKLRLNQSTICPLPIVTAEQPQHDNLMADIQYLAVVIWTSNSVPEYLNNLRSDDYKERSLAIRCT
jgi:hypothetical protein